MINDKSLLNKIYNYVSKLEFFNSFIISNKGNYIVEDNSNYYVLLAVDDKNDNMSLLPQFLCKTDDILKCYYYDNMVVEKDKYEELYSKIIGKYNYIDESIDYYFCLFEYAILYVKNIKYNYYDNGFIQYLNYSLKEYNNPLNLIIDFKERAFAKYLKYIFFNLDYNNIDLYKIIYSWVYNFNFINFELLIANLLYPDYYFIEFSKIFDGEFNSTNIKRIISLINCYEKYLIDIINCVNKFAKIKIPILGI